MSALRRAWAADRGSAVAEFAVAMPALLLVLAAALGGGQLGALQVRAQDAAADAARALGRGDAAAIGAHLARQLPDATWSSSAAGDLVCVTVTAAPVGPAAVLGLRAAASSCALSDGE